MSYKSGFNPMGIDHKVGILRRAIAAISALAWIGAPFASLAQVEVGGRTAPAPTSRSSAVPAGTPAAAPATGAPTTNLSATPEAFSRLDNNQWRPAPNEYFRLIVDPNISIPGTGSFDCTARGDGFGLLSAAFAGAMRFLSHGHGEETLIAYEVSYRARNDQVSVPVRLLKLKSERQGLRMRCTPDVSDISYRTPLFLVNTDSDQAFNVTFRSVNSSGYETDTIARWTRFMVGLVNLEGPAALAGAAGFAVDEGVRNILATETVHSSSSVHEFSLSRGTQTENFVIVDQNTRGGRVNVQVGINIEPVASAFAPRSGMVPDYGTWDKAELGQLRIAGQNLRDIINRTSGNAWQNYQNGTDRATLNRICIQAQDGLAENGFSIADAALASWIMVGMHPDADLREAMAGSECMVRRVAQLGRFGLDVPSLTDPDQAAVMALVGQENMLSAFFALEPTEPNRDGFRRYSEHLFTDLAALQISDPNRAIFRRVQSVPQNHGDWDLWLKNRSELDCFAFVPAQDRTAQTARTPARLLAMAHLANGQFITMRFDFARKAIGEPARVQAIGVGDDGGWINEALTHQFMDRASCQNGSRPEAIFGPPPAPPVVELPITPMVPPAQNQMVAPVVQDLNPPMPAPTAGPPNNPSTSPQNGATRPPSH